MMEILLLTIPDSIQEHDFGTFLEILAHKPQKRFCR